MGSKNKRVDFFIVGAPKCGTTAMASYLAEHSSIGFACDKEPHYFASDLPGHQNQLGLNDLDDYHKLFTDSDADLWGEGSVFYLTSKDAIPSISSYNPNAQYIVFFRDPVEAIASFHSQLIRSMQESELCLSEAWAAQNERLAGKRIPSNCLDSCLLQYRQVYAYGSQLKRLLSYVNPDHVHIVWYDDMRRDIAKVYNDVLRFLNIPTDGRRVFPVVNENRSHKHVWLSRFLYGRTVYGMAKAIKRVCGIKSLGVQKMLTTQARRKPVSEELATDIRRQMSGEMKQLSSLVTCAPDWASCE